MFNTATQRQELVRESEGSASELQRFKTRLGSEQTGVIERIQGLRREARAYSLRVRE